MVDTSIETQIAQDSPTTSGRLLLAVFAMIVIGFAPAATTHAQQPESNALLVQAGVSLNKGLNILQQRLDVLNSNADMLESTIATQFGSSALGDPALAPSALSAIGAEYQANLKEMRASITESQRLISLAKSSGDQTFAIQLAVSACEWSRRASSFSEELHAPPQLTATTPAAIAPKLESMPGFVRDTAELYQKLDQLSGRVI